MEWPVVAIPSILVALSVGLSLNFSLIAFRRKWYIAIEAFLACLIAAGNAYLINIYGYDWFIAMCPLAMFVPLAIKAYIFAKFRGLRFLFSLACVVVMVFFTTEIAYVICYFIPLGPEYFVVLLAAFSFLVFAIFRKLATKSFDEVLSTIPDGWGVYSLPLIFQSAFILVTMIMLKYIDIEVAMVATAVMAISMLLTVVAFFKFFSQIKEKMNLEIDLDIMHMQQGTLEKLDHERELREADVKRLRHDQRHVFQLIIDEINEGDTDSAIEHLEDLRGDRLSENIRYCENFTVNSILSTWAYKAQDAGIDMEIRADVPENLKIDSMELSVLFGNLIENAYEACLRVEKDEAKRFINFTCRHTNGKLICMITNTCRDDIVFEDGMPKSQKRGSGAIGTRSAKATVQEHDGEIRYSAENGVFTTRFVIGV